MFLKRWILKRGTKENSIQIPVNEVFDENGKLVLNQLKKFVDELIAMKSD